MHTPVTVLPSDPAVRRVGHFDERDPSALRFAWPATELTVAFTGPSIYVTFSDEPNQDDTPETDWIAVEIDGDEQRPLALRRGRREYELGTNLGPGVHTLRLRKRTEAEMGTVTVHGFRLGEGGAFQAAPRREERRIEVIGDSISAGYGNEGINGAPHRAAFENATRTYAAVAARELDAELVVTAWSGKGVLRNFQGNGATMPELFERVLPAGEHSPKTDTEPAPDVVVVHLGTNDFSVSTPEEAAFVRAYEQLLERVHIRAPQAKLVVVLSPMLSETEPRKGARSTLKRYLSRVVAHQKAKGRAALLVEQAYDDDDTYGTAHHPNLRTHARFGRELAHELRGFMGW